MGDFQEQYRMELRGQERRANSRTLRCVAWVFAALVVIWLLNFLDIFVLDITAVSAAVAGASCCYLIPLAIRMRCSLEKPWIKYLLLASTCLSVGILNAILSFHTPLFYVLPLILAIQYRRSKAIWFTFAVDSVFMTSSCLCSFYWGICDMNLLFSGNHTRQWYLTHLSDMASSFQLEENPVFVMLFYATLPRIITLFLFTLILQNIISSNNEDAKRIADLTYRKETDIRTQLYNKNKFEEMVADYYPSVERVAVLFWDLNNLKWANDTYGHAEGDALIECLASVLNRYSSDRCRVYRIGGDEFLMVLDHPAWTEAKELEEKICSVLKTQTTDQGLSVSAAVGRSEGPGAEIRRIEHEADEAMYRDKAQKKSANGR